MTEAAVVRACVKELDRRRAWHFNVGASNGDTGLPDRMAVYRGVALALEFKRRRGGRISAKQAWHHELARAAGAQVVVARCVEDLAAVLDQIDQDRRNGEHMNVILLIQTGENGPVKIVETTDKGRPRKLVSLQRGNPDVLHVRAVLDGDERLARRLHVAWEASYLERDWYEPDVLSKLPHDVRRSEHDDYEERRRIAAIGLDDLVKRG